MRGVPLIAGILGLEQRFVTHSLGAAMLDKLPIMDREREVIASSDIIELATKYTAGIIQNHPFIDGNKRTGFALGVLFLELNGYRFTASEEAAAQAILELAPGTIDEK